MMLLFACSVLQLTAQPITTIPNGKDTGFAKVVLPDGAEYEGNWKAKKFHGFGILKKTNGEVFEGNWDNGNASGDGKYTSADGAVYTGKFFNGKRHGKGILLWPDGASFDGEWANDLRNGYGIYKAANGEIYVGNYANDERYGLGKLITATGMYGEGFIDTTNGMFALLKGKIIFEDGSSYEGMMEKGTGSFQGYGKRMYVDGKVDEGLWKANAIQEKMTLADYEKKYGKVELPQLPEWIKSYNIIDTIDYETRQYVLPRPKGFYVYRNSSGGNDSLSYANMFPNPLVRLYELRTIIHPLPNAKTLVLTLRFYTNEVKVVSYLLESEPGSDKYARYSNSYPFLKIPGKDKPISWTYTLDGGKIACTAEFKTITIDGVPTEAIELVQNNSGYVFKLYLVKGRGIFSIDDEGNISVLKQV